MSDLLPPNKELCCPAGIKKESVKKDCIGAVAGEVVLDSILYGCPSLINRRRKLRGETELSSEDFQRLASEAVEAWDLEVDFMVENIENHLKPNEGQGE